jgi:RNA polymerase sigma-70 factor, ECF subfamily
MNALLAAQDHSGSENEEFIGGLREGRSEAFEELVRQFGGRMLSTAKRFLRDEEDAVDAVQDAFLSAYRNINSFAGDSRVYTWLHRILINACLMRLRSRSRRPTVSLNECVPRFYDRGDLAQDTFTQVIGQEMRTRVRECIQQLPEPYRRVLVLRDIEERDTRETAEFLGESLAGVKTRLHRARRALRKLLEPGVWGEAEFRRGRGRVNLGN